MDRTSPRSFWILAFALTLLGVGVRALGLKREPWNDELYSLYESGADLTFLAQGDQPPLYFWLLGVAGAHYDPLHARLVSLTFALLLMIVVLLATRAYGDQGALLGLALAACCPMLIRYGVEIRAYGLLCLLTAVALWLVSEVVHRPDSEALFVPLAGVLMLASWTHAVGILVAPATVLVLLASRYNLRLRAGLALLIAPTLATMAWLWAYDMMGKTSHTSWISKPYPDYVATELLWMTIGEAYFPVAVHGLPAVVLYSIGAVSFVVGLILILGGADDPRGRAYLYGGMAYLALMLLISVVKPILLARTLLPLLVFVVFYVAASLKSVRDSRRKRSIVLCFVMFSLSSSLLWGGLEASRDGELWAEGMTHLRHRLESGDLVVHVPGLKAVTGFYLRGVEDAQIVFFHRETSLVAQAHERVVYMLVANGYELHALDSVTSQLAPTHHHELDFKNVTCSLYRFSPKPEGDSEPVGSHESVSVSLTTTSSMMDSPESRLEESAPPAESDESYSHPTGPTKVPCLASRDR